MLTIALSMLQAPSRVGVSTTNVIVIVLVLGAVGLVLWASRPSVISKYAADRPESPAKKEKQP